MTDYLNQCPEDVFGLEAHFDNWCAAPAERPVLFLRYESLWRHEKRLARLLGIPDARLPDFVPRAADWQQQPFDLRDKLDAQLGPLARRFDLLPDIFGTYDGQEITA